MVRMLGGNKFYFIQEVADIAGVSRQTMHRWLKEGRIDEPARDRNGWRIFDESEVRAIKKAAERVSRKVEKS